MTAPQTTDQQHRAGRDSGQGRAGQGGAGRGGAGRGGAGQGRAGQGRAVLFSGRISILSRSMKAKSGQSWGGHVWAEPGTRTKVRSEDVTQIFRPHAQMSECQQPVLFDVM